MNNTASTKSAIAVIIAVSIGSFLFLVWLNYFKSQPGTSFEIVRYLPAVNALFNSMSAIFVVLGVLAIKNKKISIHRFCMGTAFLFSTLFLLSYVTYHHFHGDTLFQGQGWIRPVYFFVLISHIVLSGVALPMILITFYFSLTNRISRHRKLAKWTFPVWLYVSVTGVLVYFFLKAYS